MRNPINHIVDKQIKELGSTISFWLHVTSRSSNIYGENKDKSFAGPRNVHALVYYEPTQDMHTELGMDKERMHVIIKVSEAELRRHGLLRDELFITTDDRMVIKGESFRIIQIKPQAHFMDVHSMYAFGGLRA